MSIRHAAALAFALAGSIPNSAGAQFYPQPQREGPSLIGTWSGTVQGGQAGEISEQFNEDGTYFQVERMVDGEGFVVLTKQWGQYRIQQNGPSGFVLQQQVQGFAPTQGCSAAGGDCRPIPVPRLTSDPIAFLSPSSIRIGPAVLNRSGPGLLAYAGQVPQTIPFHGAPPSRSPSGGGGYCGAGTGGTGVGIGRQCDDDLQAERVCRLNNGALIQDRNGHYHCMAP